MASRAKRRRPAVLRRKIAREVARDIAIAFGENVGFEIGDRVVVHTRTSELVGEEGVVEDFDDIDRVMVRMDRVGDDDENPCMFGTWELRHVVGD